jgi:hypothetical protein
MKYLLALNIWKFAGDEIEKFRAQYPARDWAYNHLPRYCLNDKGGVEYTPHWLQFAESPDQHYWLFDVAYAEGWLAEELVESGFEMFDGIDWRPLFEYFKGEFTKGLTLSERITKQSDYEAYGKSIPPVYKVIVDLQYFSSGDDDYDMECSVWGYLDGDMNPQNYKDLMARYFILNSNPERLPLEPTIR